MILANMTIKDAIVVLVLICLSRTLSWASVSAGSHKCQCLPDQWEGILETVYRDFELQYGKTEEWRSREFVHYDYTNRKLATMDLNSGRKSIADYTTGLRFNVNKHGCRAIRTDDSMRKMCFPVDTDTISDTILGADLPVTIFKFSEPYNMSVTTTVSRDLCIPISEDISVSDNGYVSLTSTVYTEVKLGISDRRVFQEPDDVTCVKIDNVNNILSAVIKRRQKQRLPSRVRAGGE